MAYFLLTGATGLLGRYLLRDLTLADVPLAVVVRSSKRESASVRIETAMAHWEKTLGRALVRPVVLEGDIARAWLGLSDADIAWVAANCRAMIHSAASLTFHADEKTGEPLRSNVQGTRNMLALSARAGIRHCHHVSTAYVCGRRRGRILESEVDLGQEPSNDYEATKLLSEKEVRASDAFEQVTVYRPSIIVGDSVTGYTTSYHGFYTPLRLVHSLVTAMSWQQLLTGDFLGRLELAGNERKNLVPVEWVSAAMTSLVTRPACHGRTYHLANPQPVTALAMQDAIVEALAEVATDQPPASPSPVAAGDFVASFREQMKVYESYWSDDPEFDTANTQAALPQLPCPAITPQVMLRLIRYAIGTNFGWPRETPVIPEFNVASALDKWLAAGNRRGRAADERYVSLQVSGRGGGQWHLVIDRGRLVGAGVGVRNGSSPTCYLTSDTFAGLARGRLKFEDSINSGRLVVAGNSVHPSELARLLGDLMVGPAGPVNLG